jgi:hypothetical protein
MSEAIQQRLGTRVKAQIPVRLTSLDPSLAFSESCYTLLVNPKGCGVRCQRPLEPGLRVKVDQLPGGEAAMARVACSIPPKNGGRFWIIGIGLDTPANLWHMFPTPPDWGTYASSPSILASVFGD